MGQMLRVLERVVKVLSSHWTTGGERSALRLLLNCAPKSAAMIAAHDCLMGYLGGSVDRLLVAFWSNKMSRLHDAPGTRCCGV